MFTNPAGTVAVTIVAVEVVVAITVETGVTNVRVSMIAVVTTFLIRESQFSGEKSIFGPDEIFFMVR